MEDRTVKSRTGRKNGQKTRRKDERKTGEECDGSEDDSECGRFEARSSTRHSQCSVRRNEGERPSPMSQSKCSDTSQQHQSKSTLHSEEEPIDEREYFFECPCKKNSRNKHGFMRHMKDKHAYHLLSELYIPVRQTLANNGFFSDFFKEHKKVIEEIESSSAIAFAMPEELRSRLSREFVSKALRKYKEMGVLMEKPLFDLYEERVSNEQRSEAFLSASVMQSLKQLTLKYLNEFQRHFEMFIKNISLSELITLFLYNFAFNVRNHSNGFLRLQKMQLFEVFMSDFKSWVNQNYAKVFSLNRVFFYHIETDIEYCRTERTWNIGLLVRSYLQQKRKRAILAFKPINFILLCFQEYLKAEELIEQ